MANAVLILAIELDRRECIRGESVLFTVTLTNDSNAGLTKFPPFSSELSPVVLFLDGRKGQRQANQRSFQEREGTHRHGPSTPPTSITLAPRQKLQLQGDLLSWFGDMEPGEYTVTARHAYGAESKPVPLKVLPARAISASAPRYTTQGPASPMPAAWGHKQGDETLLFFQQQSPVLPRNVIHGFRAETVAEEVHPYAALIANSDVRSGHLVWLQKENRVSLTPVDLENGKSGPRREIKLPFAGELLPSPLSMPGGALWLPVAQKDRNAASFLEVLPDGKVNAFDLDLGQAKPLGAYVCFWEHGRQLHFSWAAEQGREVMLASLALSDPRTGFVKRSLYAPADPVFWLDAFIDIDAPARDAPYFEEQIPPGQRTRPLVPEPPLVVACVTQSASSLNFVHVNTTDGQHKRVAMLPLAGLDAPRCLGGVVTYEFQLVLLMADAQDRLFVASTTSNSVRAISDLVSPPPSAASFPSLVAATRQARSPWVYVRYLEKDLVQYLRLEPVEERDPIERDTATPTRRRRR